MARIWTEGFEFQSGNTLCFIGGIRDGEIMGRDDAPPEIKFPILDSEEGEVVRYKRVGDTLNYVCLDWLE